MKSELETELLGLPNLAHTSVPAGSTEEDNEVVKDLTGTIPDLGDDAMPHWDLSDKYGIFDLKLGVKLAKKHYETEASGNVSLKKVKSIAATGVNRISVGSITHSAPAVDFKLEI